MKRLTFFKVYGTEDPKLAERRMRLLPNDTRYWSPANSEMFMAISRVLDLLERCLTIELPEREVRRDRYRWLGPLQPYHCVILNHTGPFLLDGRRSEQRHADAAERLVAEMKRTDHAQFDDVAIEVCRNCKGSPRKGLIRGLCFRCSGEKASNHAI